MPAQNDTQFNEFIQMSLMSLFAVDLGWIGALPSTIFTPSSGCPLVSFIKNTNTKPMQQVNARANKTPCK